MLTQLNKTLAEHICAHSYETILTNQVTNCFLKLFLIGLTFIIIEIFVRIIIIAVISLSIVERVIRLV